MPINIYLSNFTNDYLNYRKPTETGGVSYVERFPAGSKTDGKIHAMLHFRKIIQGRASEMVKHEEKILDYLTNQQVPYTARLLDYQNSPNHQNPELSTQTIVTEAAGVDLYLWGEVPIAITELNRSFASIYDHPLFVVSALKGSLNALQQIHNHGIVHCDIKLDNICLPYKGQADRGEIIEIRLNDITLIDFGTSCWLGNIVNNERIWLGYNENESERYQSRFLIKTLKQWCLDNQGRQGPPYNNTVINQINYSCDLYSLGVAFESLYQDKSQHECWDLVAYGLQSVITELKSYDNGIPSDKQQYFPHAQLIQQLDSLIQDIISYEKNQGNAVDTNKMHGKLTDIVKPRRLAPVPTPTPIQQPIETNQNTNINTTGIKKSSKAPWVIGSVLAFALVLGGLINSKENDESIMATEAEIQEAVEAAQETAEMAEPTTNALDELAENSVDYSKFELVRTINISTSSVKSVAFSPDGQYIATASDALENVKSNMIFKVDNGEKVKEFESGNTAIRYSPNSKYIATASSDEGMLDNKISIYSLNNDRILEEYGSEYYLTDVEFSPNGQYFVYSEDQNLIIKNLDSANSFTIEGLGGIFAFSKKTNLLAVAQTDISILDLNQKKSIFDVRGSYKEDSPEDNATLRTFNPLVVQSLALSSNARNLAYIDESGTLNFIKINVQAGSHSYNYEIKLQSGSELSYQTKLLFTPDNTHLVVKDVRSIDIYRLSDMKKINSIQTPETWSMDISPDGKYIAVGTLHPKGQVLIYGLG